MKVNVIRGQNQIGGSIIEIETANTHIIFDAGIELNEMDNFPVPDIEGLFYGRKQYDAIFVSHYHADHIGLLGNVLKNIPIYMGKTAYKMVCAAAEYRNTSVDFSVNYVENQVSIQIGDATITPISCDHSAFDAYMYLIESGGKTILYSGDFRANGRIDKKAFFEKLPQVDALIVEGTTLSRAERRNNLEEETLEKIAVDYLKDNMGPAFIIMSAMNIDRLITAYNTALETKRVFLEDVYTAKIAEASDCDIIKPNRKNGIRVFMTGGERQYEELQSFGDARIGKSQIAKSNFLMCVRPSMRNYISKLNELCSFENGVLFYGMWKGYLENDDMRQFISFMEEKGVKLHILHTSGHADENTIEQLIYKTSPRKIIPVHTENPQWFSRYEPQIVIHLQKGEIPI